MLRRTKRVQASISFYAPSPGSALGHQLIAEGRSWTRIAQRALYEHVSDRG